MVGSFLQIPAFKKLWGLSCGYFIKKWCFAALWWLFNKKFSCNASYCLANAERRPIVSGLRKIQLAFINFTLFSPFLDVALVWLSSGLLSAPSVTAPCWAALRGRCAPNALLCLFGLMCLDSFIVLV